ncbi:hypothetical protein Maes01_02171 [Microbulbifer aestuariivivens]|uniref:Uncharacterized protein n=1 Tax=Microbulbifer aestuariivivens TaxID=1908308 RepID=A0ABP9WR87_9GAMM
MTRNRWLSPTQLYRAGQRGRVCLWGLRGLLNPPNPLQPSTTLYNRQRPDLPYPVHPVFAEGISPDQACSGSARYDSAALPSPPLNCLLFLRNPAFFFPCFDLRAALFAFSFAFSCAFPCAFPCAFSFVLCAPLIVLLSVPGRTLAACLVFLCIIGDFLQFIAARTSNTPRTPASSPCAVRPHWPDRAPATFP